MSKITVAWSDIEAGLKNMTPVSGGFSLAHRGLVVLGDGTNVFFKIGTEELSIGWAQKEIAVYRYLTAQGYRQIPELLATNADETSFALEALTSEDGWDWTDTWTEARLNATLAAMDELAQLKPVAEDWMNLSQPALDASRDGWALLLQDAELLQVLTQKLNASGNADLAQTLDIAAEADRSKRFVFRTDTIVHYDIRADNCAWNASKNQVKLVDWNWMQYGDPRIDSAAVLTHVHKAGLDVTRSQRDRLDSDALQWMAGFWLRAGSTPIWPGGPEHLRDFQLEAGVAALRLARSCI